MTAIAGQVSRPQAGWGRSRFPMPGLHDPRCQRGNREAAE